MKCNKISTMKFKQKYVRENMYMWLYSNECTIIRHFSIIMYVHEIISVRASPQYCDFIQFQSIDVGYIMYNNFFFSFCSYVTVVRRCLAHPQGFYRTKLFNKFKILTLFVSFTAF